MGKLIFILGGARSGKSRFALQLARKSGKKVTFIATALPIDKEMKARIIVHKSMRPRNWKTIEVQNNLDEKIREEKSKIILIDCLTIYIAHLMHLPEVKILDHIEKIISAVKKSHSDIIVVSNEVGCSVHPENKLGRDYRDILGKVNQIFAKASYKFYAMFAGIPIDIKKIEKINRAS